MAFNLTPSVTKAPGEKRPGTYIKLEDFFPNQPGHPQNYRERYQRAVDSLGLKQKEVERVIIPDLVKQVEEAAASALKNAGKTAPKKAGKAASKKASKPVTETVTATVTEPTAS